MKTKNQFLMSHVALITLVVFVLSACAPVNNPSAHDEVPTIAQIQGCAHYSPYNGLNVKNVTGVVTAKVYNGFYLQSQKPDERDCSSEGIFVFTNSFSDVVPGDMVQVDGVVEEFRPGMIEDRNLTITEITNPVIKKTSTGHPLPEVVEISSMAKVVPDRIIDNDSLTKFEVSSDGLDYFESLESMLVQIDQGLVVGPRNQFNEVVVIPPTYQQKNIFAVSGALLQQESDPNPERIILNLNPENTQQVHVGAILVGGAKGIMDYSYGNYKIRVFGKIEFTNNFPEPIKILNVPDSLTLATYNVENLSPQDPETKIRRIALDVVDRLNQPVFLILNEVMDDSGIEDDGTVTADRNIKRLVEKIQKEGGPRYSFVYVAPANNQDGGILGGNIRSVILFQEEKGVALVSPVLDDLLKTNPKILGSPDWPYSATRKPLIAKFEWKDQQILVTAIHLTSRGLDSPLFGSVQPIERLEEEKRVAQAKSIAEFLEKYHTKNPETLIILAGDVNDDPWSKTLNSLTSTILLDAGEHLAQKERYSYIFDGNAIQLDYILVSNNGNIRQCVIPHLNSVLDYQQQVSDHDPVYIEWSPKSP